MLVRTEPKAVEMSLSNPNNAWEKSRSSSGGIRPAAPPSWSVQPSFHHSSLSYCRLSRTIFIEILCAGGKILAIEKASAGNPGTADYLPAWAAKLSREMGFP